ncbi:DUF6548 family protein [uncultured Eubacterium sp.]|uniref:DUF6548 family protein n=1 Tax=uncultured Eubacterium sp. TaxID=165185 RepID=UPI0025982D2D|nr:DUF6548 family protein [uncultured Eubacterium sp.]
MNNTENRFFEQYKKLDNLCMDLLNSNQGVSAYIKEMEKIPIFERQLVKSWDSDYKMLKHIRWIRNNIAHSDYSSECEEKDIAYTRNFYQRIMKQEDPFSVIRKKKAIQSTKHNDTVNIGEFWKNENYKKKKNYIEYIENEKIILLILIIIFLAIVARFCF